MVEHTIPPNVNLTGGTACSSMKTTQIVMLSLHPGLGMDGVIMDHTIPPNVDMTEVTASMKTTQIVMFNGNPTLGMEIVMIGILHTIPPNVDLTEAIAWGMMMGMSIGGMMTFDGGDW